MHIDIEMVRAIMGQAEFLNQRIEQALTDARPSGLTRSQVLALVYHDPMCTPAGLARQLGITRQSMQKTLRQLESGDLIGLEPHPTDGRSKQVVLTEAGHRVRSDLERAIDGFGRRLDAAFGTDTMHVFRRVATEDWEVVLTTVNQNA